MDNPHDQALERLGDLIGRSGEPEPLLEYYRALIGAQREVLGAFDPDISALSPEVCSERAGQGKPLIGVGDVKPDWEALEALFERICALGREYAPRQDEASWPSPPPGDRDGWREAILAGVMEDRAKLDALADEAGVGRELMAHVACRALSPFLEAYAVKLRDRAGESAWLRGLCPVCGGAPVMASLGKDEGRRMLECHLCRTQWAFKRVGCPFCGNEDQKKLSYFFDEKDEAHRVEVCDECKSYLKTVDSRKTAREPVLTVEDLATLHLDVIARDEGFRGSVSSVGGRGWRGRETDK